MSNAFVNLFILGIFYKLAFMYVIESNESKKIMFVCIYSVL